ncbi:MAG: DUF1848 family protein [Candidatus Methanoperedens sp.]
MNQITIGITERGDAGLDLSWREAVPGCDGVILITKHLSPRFIQEAAKVNCIVHATITGHGGTIIEPNVMPFSESKEMFRQLVTTLGVERVVLRIDPIIPTIEGVQKAMMVYTELSGKTRIRISFMDNYPHVKRRWTGAGLPPLKYSFHAPLSQRIEIAEMFKGAEICGEPNMACSGCVSQKDLEVLGIKSQYHFLGSQRPECKCLAVKKELLQHRGQCPSGCLYCYWK